MYYGYRLPKHEVAWPRTFGLMSVINCYKFVFGQHHLTLPKRMQENSKLEQQVGKKVVLGVRPENLNVDSSLINEDKSNKLTIHVELAEMIGAETYLHSSINNEKAIIKKFRIVFKN